MAENHLVEEADLRCNDDKKKSETFAAIAKKIKSKCTIRVLHSQSRHTNPTVSAKAGQCLMEGLMSNSTVEQIELKSATSTEGGAVAILLNCWKQIKPFKHFVFF